MTPRLKHLKGVSLRQGSSFTRKYQTRLEMLARDKPSSLLQKIVNCGREKFYRFCPRLDTDINKLYLNKF